MPAPTILLSAGEPSGDLHGAALAHALRARWPGARLFGLGGARMREAGVELLADPERLSVMGFAEVVRHLPFFARLLGRVRREMERRHADLVLPIDYPGFNLRLAAAAHQRGIPVLYYIAPQVWAWHRSRMRQLARLADRLAVVLPFEERLFREAGARAQFVGHPLLDARESGQATGAERVAGGDGPIVALFPGSRSQELGRHLSLFEAAAAILERERPGLRPVIGAPVGIAAGRYAAARYPVTTDSRALLRDARAALVKSGTGTLEAALAGTPLVVAYRTHPLTFALARRLVGVEHVGLVNLVAGERVAPELLQNEATPARLADALRPLLDEGPARARMLEGLARVRGALRPPTDGAGSVAERVARLAAELVTG